MKRRRRREEQGGQAVHGRMDGLMEWIYVCLFGVGERGDYVSMRRRCSGWRRGGWPLTAAHCVSVDFFFALFVFFLHDSDHKMSVVDSCATMQTGLAVVVPLLLFCVCG